MMETEPVEFEPEPGDPDPYAYGARRHGPVEFEAEAEDASPFTGRSPQPAPWTVGMEVYYQPDTFQPASAKISKVTKILTKGRCRIEDTAGMFDRDGHPCTSARWPSKASIQPLTDELRQKIQESTERQRLIQKITRRNWDAMTTDQLRRVAAIVSEKQP
jgi:hypothetical protein